MDCFLLKAVSYAQHVPMPQNCLSFPKKKLKAFFFSLAFTLSGFLSQAQDSLPHLRISVLTCAAGEELYSVFGHTALRIIDSVQHSDIVYNYGTFDFSDPDFYTKFTRGTLDYMLSAYSFQDFMSEYYADKRSVTEQELKLTAETKKGLRNALNQNLTGASRYYKYVFNDNNCTTRIRDLLFQYGGFMADQVLVPAGTTCRDMLHEALDNGNQPWSKLGIDMILGSRIDQPLNISSSMFLPDYLMKGIDSSVRSKNILQEKKLIYESGVVKTSSGNRPLYLFSILALSAILISIPRHKTAKRITAAADVTLLTVTGLTGLFLLFMWLGTNHVACSNNYNLLWASPLQLVTVVGMRSKSAWWSKWTRILAIVYALLLISWAWLPQQLNPALIPVCIWIGWCLFRFSNSRHA
jgi:hypothetical protein